VQGQLKIEQFQGLEAVNGDHSLLKAGNNTFKSKDFRLEVMCES
jgi:hypothetical protein